MNGTRQRAGTELGVYVRIARRRLVREIGDAFGLEERRFRVPNMSHENDCYVNGLIIS